MQLRIHDNGVVPVVAVHVISNEDLVRVKNPRERERISESERKSKVLAIPGNLTEIHASESQWLVIPHHVRDPGNFLIDPAVRVQEVTTWYGLVEHRLTYLVVAAVPRKALFGSVVDARRAKRAQQVSDCGNHLLIWRSVRKAAAWLPERVVVIDEGDEVPPDLTPVECALTLCFEAVKQSLRTLKAFEHIAKSAMPIALGKAEIQNRIQTEEDGVVAVLTGSVLADVAVIEIVVSL